MPRNQEIVVQEHNTSMFAPIKESKFLRSQPSQELFSLILLLKAISFGKNEGIFVRTDSNKIFLLELLQVLNQILVWFLNKDNISHRLIHALLELFQFFLLVQKRLLEKGSVELQIFFCITFAIRTRNKLADIRYNLRNTIYSQFRPKFSMYYLLTSSCMDIILFFRLCSTIKLVTFRSRMFDKV